LHRLPDDTKFGRKKPLGENHSIWLLTIYGLHTDTASSGVNKSEHSYLFTVKGKGKGTAHLRTDHEGPDGSKSVPILFL
jgi:hypothetical protein